MLSRLTALVLALVMVLPLCWCCAAEAPAAAAAAEEETCSACRYAEVEQDLPASSPVDSHQDRRCCAKAKLRNLSPDVAAAPRLVLVDLQAWVWMRADLAAPPVKVDLDAIVFSLERHAASHAPPLYQRHCALLI
ncbi:MAG TPA: hypothetical protein VD994_05915 [Prosthecobacter sp.]|nr:hypothetical protein [Prosthecobacter sp.]